MYPNHRFQEGAVPNERPRCRSFLLQANHVLIHTLIESDVDEHEIADEVESVDLDEAYEKLVSEDKTSENPAEDEDVLAALSKFMTRKEL